MRAKQRIVTPLCQVLGEKNQDQSGFAVSGGFDINGDNIADIIIGAPDTSPLSRDQAGTSYIYIRQSRRIS